MYEVNIEELTSYLIDEIQRDRFNGSVSQEVADDAIRAIDQMYGTHNAEYYFVEDADECTCGNPEYGFDCMCDWMKKHPGNIEFCCEFCGIYYASKARCSECEANENWDKDDTL